MTRPKSLTSPSPTETPRRRRRRIASLEGPDPVDAHVGWRVKLRRTLLGMSQERLAEAVGLTFQQIQKYERGANRISASMLHRLAKALDVPVSFFFDDMPEDMALHPPSDQEDALTRRESLELLRYYYRIPTTKRKLVYELVKSVGRGEDQE